MHAAILRSGTLLALAALGISTATAQTELYFATGVDSTVWAQAQSNADGHVLIESPQYPRGLWLHLADEAGDALADIRVEYQGRPDSLVAIHCVDPAGGVRETLVWTRAEGDPLRLTLKPKEASDLPAGVALIDWQRDPTAESLLEPVEKDLSISWPDLTAFLREHWQEKPGRVVVQLDSRTVLAVDLDHLESIERLVNYLQDQATTVRGAINTSTLQILLNARAFNLALPESVVILSTFLALLFEDPNLEKWVLGALGRRKGPITLSQAASLTELSISNPSIFDSSFHSLSGIEHLVALETLFLESCDLTDVRPLAALSKLESLRLGYNQIADVSPLATLTKLTWIDLNDNQIEDISSLVANTGLGGGDWVNLVNNPLSDQALNEHIPALEARGVDVSY